MRFIYPCNLRNLAICGYPLPSTASRQSDSWVSTHLLATISDPPSPYLLRLNSPMCDNLRIAGKLEVTGDFPDPPGPRSLSNRFVVHPAFPLARSRAVFAAASISAFASSNVCWSRRLSSTYTPRFLWCAAEAEWRAQCGVFILPLSRWDHVNADSILVDTSDCQHHRLLPKKRHQLYEHTSPL